MMTSVTHKLHAEKKGFYSSIPIEGLKLHVAIIKIQVAIMLYGVLLMGSIKAIQYKFKLFDYFPVIYSICLYDKICSQRALTSEDIVKFRLEIYLYSYDKGLDSAFHGYVLSFLLL